MRCIEALSSPSASSTTATGLPKNGRSVKTSTCMKGWVSLIGQDP
jgi:hypothetical protein